MGCYGFGVTRTIGALIEQCHDDKGIIWPPGLTPFDVILTVVNNNDENCRKIGNQIYEGLLNEGVDVLLDDRDLGAGFKFKDADLVGIPFRVTVGARSLKEGKVELSVRSDGTILKVTVEKAVSELLEKLRA